MIGFPSGTGLVIGDTHTIGDVTWVWNGYAWDIQAGTGGGGITDAFINTNGELVLVFVDNTIVNLGPVIGPPGTPGENGTPGIGISQAFVNTNGELVLIYSDNTITNLGVVVGPAGPAGENGENGLPGTPGENGISITNAFINTNGDLVLVFSDNSVINVGNVVGMDGAPGTPGENGTPGTPGENGISITNAFINTNGELVLVFSDNSVINVGVVVGPVGENGTPGTPGENGISVVDAFINSNSELVFVLSDDTTINVGIIQTGTPGTGPGETTNPGGSNTHIQFNDSGIFGGDADFTWNKSTNVLDINGSVYIKEQNTIRFYDGDSSNYVSLSAPSTVSSNVALTLPATAGNNGEVLTTDGSGVLSWTAATGSGGTKTYAVFTPLDAVPSLTNFATLDTRNGIPVLEFDFTDIDEFTNFIGIIPEGANLTSGLKIRIHWMADTSTSGNVRWGVKFERIATDDIDNTNNFDESYSAGSNEANGTANAVSGVPTITEITITAIDSISAGDAYRLCVYREASDTANDTMGSDAQLIALEVRSAI